MCELIAFLTIYERGVLSLEMSDNSERYSVLGVEGKDEPIQSYLRLWLLWRLCLQLVLGRCLRLENIINQISDSAKGKPPVWTSRQRNSKTGQQACFHSTHTSIIMTTAVQLHTYETHMYSYKNYWDREKERKTERQGQTSLNPQTTSCILHTKLVTFSIWQAQILLAGFMLRNQNAVFIPNVLHFW